MSSLHAGWYRTPVQTRVTFLLPPVLSGVGTSFPVLQHLHRSLVTSCFLPSYFNYSSYLPVAGWPTTSVLAWITQGTLFNRSLVDSMSILNILFFFFFFFLFLLLRKLVSHFLIQLRYIPSITPLGKRFRQDRADNPHKSIIGSCRSSVIRFNELLLRR